MLVLRVIYYLVAVLCICVSVYLTFFGFKRTFGELTPFFTAIIGLMLFAADFLFQRRRERSESYTAALLFFCLVAFFSSISNFNFLYTNFMTRDVEEQTLRTQYKIFNDDLVKTDKALENIAEVKIELQRRERVLNELTQMWEQMSDPGRPGCGTRCGEHIDNIQGLVGASITPLARPGVNASRADLSNFFDSYKQAVNAALDSSTKYKNYLEVQALRGRIDNALETYNFDAALRRGDGLEILTRISEESQQIERLANSLLDNSNNVSHEEIDPTLGRLGEIIYTLENGFVELPNPGATIFSLILSILVDILPILFAFAAFRPGEQEGSISEIRGYEDLDVLN